MDEATAASDRVKKATLKAALANAKSEMERSKISEQLSILMDGDTSTPDVDEAFILRGAGSRKFFLRCIGQQKI